MQPFDALTMRAVLEEAKPLLLNRKIDKIFQLSRDEILLQLRLRAAQGYFLLSANSAFGRICLIDSPALPKNVNPPAFCQLLRKHLSGAIIADIQQISGERVCDFVFACVDELGGRSIKVLTAEVMGRHSNLIFWDKQTGRILGASHVVTAEMSRQREVAAGLPYVRPPQQNKINIFDVSREEFFQAWEKRTAASAPNMVAGASPPETLTTDRSGGVSPEPNRSGGVSPEPNRSGGVSPEPNRSGGVSPEPNRSGGVSPPLAHATTQQWLISSFAGIGKSLAEELASKGSATSLRGSLPDNPEDLWQRIAEIQKVQRYKPAAKSDLTCYTVLSRLDELNDTGAACGGETPPLREATDWCSFDSVNEMVDWYYRTLQRREQMNQLRERIRAELKNEADKIRARLEAAHKQLQSTLDIDRFKKYGDMILANVGGIEPGQTELRCDDLYLEDGTSGKICIELNPNINAAQNAQSYYRQFAKARARQQSAGTARAEAEQRMADIDKLCARLAAAHTMEDLVQLKEQILDRGKRTEQQKSGGTNKGGKPMVLHGGAKKSPKLSNFKSSDGWLIYIGKNRIENDALISKLADPADIWLHVLGVEGAHVLIKNPNKQDPPGSTIREAAQVAARFSKISLGSKVRVVYTHCRYVRKIGKDKPGLVRYENEKTLEVDTAAPMPQSLKKLFP